MANEDDALRLALMEISERIKPMHDWLIDERAYFLSQGYDPDEARAMAAATYVTVFGTLITRKTGRSDG